MREIFLKSVLSIGCGRGTPEEGGIGPGVDAVGDAVEVLRGWMERGTPEEGDTSNRQEKNMRGRKWTGRPVLKCWTGTEYSYKYRRIPRTRWRSVPP